MESPPTPEHPPADRSDYERISICDGVGMDGEQ